MVIAPGDQLSERYRVGDVLGRGGMAEVRRARDLVLDREVAVKILRDTVDDTDRSRFVAEARVLAQLSHVGLVTVLDAGITAAQPYLVMELVEGTTLGAALRHGPLRAVEVARIGGQLAAALAYAHDQGVIHRDVKPANVLLGREGQVKLADFGIARLIGDTVRHTRTGTLIGTAAYLSPEQVQGQPVGPSTDVYSLALVLLEALTGERAFAGSPAEAALARLHRQPDVPEWLPGSWRSLLSAMTAPEPAARPAAGVVAERLRAFAATSGPTSAPPPAPPAPPSPPPPPPAPVTADRQAATQVLATSPPPTVPLPAPPVGAPVPRALDRAGAGLARWTAKAWRRFSRLPEHHKGAAIAVACLVLLLVVIAIVAGGSDETADQLPPRTPAELRAPLQDLHDAVHGRTP